uniref:Uncharacterized protein n=1 Tax=Plectus sambesii TaxID=2011161 RepID=A0A914V016_9BILA
MHVCWKDKPDERPFFSDLKIEFGTLLSNATEEYGYLDIRKPNDGQYFQQVSNDSGDTQQSGRHREESIASNDADRQSEVDAPTSTSYESVIKY